MSRAPADSTAPHTSMPGRNLVVITGSSGVGKSTVARGHLAPHLSLDSTQASVEDIAARIATAVREELGS